VEISKSYSGGRPPIIDSACSLAETELPMEAGIWIIVLTRRRYSEHERQPFLDGAKFKTKLRCLHLRERLEVLED
jgi:hypothetical protein